MTGNLIGSVRLTPATVRPGEPVLVQALSPAGAVLDAQSGITLAIDGVEAYERYEQFAQPGEHRVHVQATGGSGAATAIDDASATVTVDGDPVTFRRSPGEGGAAELALLQIWPDFGHPYTIHFRLGDPAAGRRTGLPAAPLEAPAPGPQPSAGGAGASPPAGLVTALDRYLAGLAGKAPAPAAGAAGSPPAPAGAAAPPAAPVTYHWDFGDGTTDETQGPAVSHDYFPAMDAARVTRAFNVTCRVSPGDVVARLTIGLQSAYGLCKARGVIVPHVEADVLGAKGTGAFSGTLTVYNNEDQPLTLTESAAVPLGDDPDAAPPAPAFVPLAAPVVLPPRSATGLAAFVPADTQPGDGVLSHDAPGFVITYKGQAQDGTPVRFSATFGVPSGRRGALPYHQDQAAPAAARRQSWPWAQVGGGLAAAAAPRPGGPEAAPAAAAPAQVDRATGTVAVPLAAAAGRTGRAQLRAAALAGLDAIAAQSLQQGQIEPASRPAPPAAGPAAAPAAAGGVSEGQDCDPNNIAAAEAASAAAQGLSPQLAEHDSAQRVLMPSRFVNALKGDVIISPGGPDVIGVLLRSLNPHQYHNHSGMMTRNYTEITHCTANEDRMADYPETVLGLPVHVQPAALKYMWPGIITQSIDAAVYGEAWRDEGTQKRYTIVGFSGERVGVTGVVTPPLVIKPDVETPEARQKLAAVAETAAGMGARVDAQGNIVVKSKGHYRLYGYTDPAIGLTEVAGPEAGWAAGTVPAVCSSFVWLCLQKNQVHLGGRPASSRDGLCAYTAEERRSAGAVLFDNIANSIAEQAGWLGSFVARRLGIAEGIANQVLNTFTGDDPNPATTAAGWRSTGACEAVSPDNILTYLGTADGGLYGFSEPLVYQEPRWEASKVFRWTKAGPAGRIGGRVTLAGQPAAGVQVQVYEGKAATSAADGTYLIEDVPGGTYEISAKLVAGGIYYEAEGVVTVTAAGATADLALRPPVAAYRLAGLTASFAGTYTELLETRPMDVEAEQYWQPLNPGRVTADQFFSYAYPEGHVASFKLHLVHAADDSLVASLEGWLYDASNRAAGAELAHNWTAPFTVAPGAQVATSLSLSAASVLPPWAVQAKLTLLVANQQDPA